MSKKRKIAFFHNLPPGGGFRVFEKIIQTYKNKIDIDLYVVSDLRPQNIKGVNLKYIKIKPWKGFFLRNLWLLIYLPIIHKNISKKINNEYEKIFITHDYLTKSPYLLRFLTIPSVYLCHEPQREFYESWKIHAPTIKNRIANLLRLPIKYIDEKNVRMATIVISNSKYSKKINDKIYNVKSQVVYPGVDEKNFKPEKNIKKNSILCVGGLNSVKDQLFLIKSITPLLKKITLNLIGDGEISYKNKIIKFKKQGLKIEINSKISDRELHKYYTKAYVTCITAHNEPFGLSSIESQSCGTPVVAINEGGVSENIINGHSGYLVKRDSRELLSRVKEAIVNNKTMGDYGRRNVLEKWTWDKTLKNLDKFIL